jgi:hypothetical protein
MDNIRRNCQWKQEEIMLLVCGGCVRVSSLHRLVNLSGRMTVVVVAGGEQ